jgi:hypothetical protein
VFDRQHKSSKGGKHHRVVDETEGFVFQPYYDPHFCFFNFVRFHFFHNFLSPQASELFSDRTWLSTKKIGSKNTNTSFFNELRSPKWIREVKYDVIWLKIYLKKLVKKTAKNK